MQISAMAIMARWRKPARELERIGDERPLRVGEADPGEDVDGTCRAASALPTLPCSSSASLTWSPTVCSGESEVIGSWKIMAMRPPRKARMVSPSGSSAAMSTGGSPFAGSSNRIDPPPMRATFGRMRRIACAVTDLPEPDSPTSATVLPFGTSNDRPSTARKAPTSDLKSIDRSRIDRSGDVQAFLLRTRGVFAPLDKQHRRGFMGGAPCSYGNNVRGDG